jgi:hypothetical protein
MLFICSVSRVRCYKPFLILSCFWVCLFLLFIKREFYDKVAMFMASSSSKGDLFVIYVLDPFLIPEFQTYGFSGCSRNVHLYADSCVQCVSSF